MSEDTVANIRTSSAPGVTARFLKIKVLLAGSAGDLESAWTSWKATLDEEIIVDTQFQMTDAAFGLLVWYTTG